MHDRPQDVQATFCATLVDEWARAGVAHAVMSPGSRSTPLALALDADERLRLEVHVDERSAGFMALGIARATSRPVVVLTTSGTAAVELHPAVVEADLAGVPLVVCTADRPPELRDVAAPQTIDQTHLFGRSARWFVDVGVADVAAADRWRPLAARAAAEALSPRPGPVHVNLPFREPLLGTAGALPPARDGDPWARRLSAPVIPPLAEVPGLGPATGLVGRRGIIVAGEGCGPGDGAEALAAALRWPLLADPRSGARRPAAVVVAHADQLLRSSEVARRLRPEVVLRLGGAPASRVVAEWLAASGASEVVVAGTARWPDATGTAAVLLDGAPAAVAAAWAREAQAAAQPDGATWLAAWRQVDDAATEAIDSLLAGQDGPTEPGVARDVLAALSDGSELVVSSSMPVRDLEWFGRPRHGVCVHANRGANGIDGVVSTAVGVALGSGAPTAALLGDLAFVHDSNGLVGAARRGIDLVLVVVDNDGGGIFSFLPQAGQVDEGRFELLYGTPHGLDLVAVGKAMGARASAVTDVAAGVREAVAAGGVHVLVAHTDRRANVDLHDRLADAVRQAAERALGRVFSGD